MTLEPTHKYLIMLSSNGNHNKVYRMTANGDSFTVEYGRIGASMQTRSYPISQWNKKYSEKIAKGYVDRTELVQDLIEKQPVKTPGSDGYRAIENKAIAEIVDRLQRMARKAVAENYTVSSNKVTMAMVNEAQNVLTSLVSCPDVDTFNKTLLELYSVIPRKMGKVADHMARSTSDFGRIIEREQDLLDVMKGQVYVPPKPSEIQAPVNETALTILEEKGLIFEEASNEDVIKIKSCLGSCADKFHRAWRVRNLNTQAAFDAYVSKENISTKLLWHGSRNENWWSIINTGLVLRPTNAVITGKMFGYGIYFATKARKSLGYTSLTGSYWAHGSSSSAFMALYEVAYGKPYDVHSFESRFHSFDYKALQQACPGAHCLHAHEGQMLRNDEIIVYQECQTTIRYLVELK